MSHGDSIEKPPPGFEVTGSSRTNPVAAHRGQQPAPLRHPVPPEVKHSQGGMTVLANFLDICGCRRDWNAASFVESSVEKIRTTVGNERVLCACPAGWIPQWRPCSSTARRGPADLRVRGQRVLRKDEAAQVRKRFAEKLQLNVVFVDASKRFLAKLKGVKDPERKRKVIGKEFIEVFTKEARRLGKPPFLAQGTLYPDVIESTSVRGPSAVIKSHHNVGGLPKNMKFKLSSPCASFSRTKCARPASLSAWTRSSCTASRSRPRPGRALPGPVDRERLDLLREADDIVARRSRPRVCTGRSGSRSPSSCPYAPSG
jgi:GMP synthase (glutamine-hydrolysing)